LFRFKGRERPSAIAIPAFPHSHIPAFAHFPLPPLSEQHRIVAKIDQLMALCDAMENQITSATHKQTTLLEALLKGV
jgi:hypothetical protein